MRLPRSGSFLELSLTCLRAQNFWRALYWSSGPPSDAGPTLFGCNENSGGSGGAASRTQALDNTESGAVLDFSWTTSSENCERSAAAAPALCESGALAPAQTATPRRPRSSANGSPDAPAASTNDTKTARNSQPETRARLPNQQQISPTHSVAPESELSSHYLYLHSLFLFTKITMIISAVLGIHIHNNA